MTLTRQIIMIFIGALMLLFVGTFFVTMQHIKGYFEDQLNNNAQDTATALGLTLSEKLQQDAGQAEILSKVKAVFDRGYFRSIVVQDIDGNIVVKRFLKSQTAFAPDWFKSWISIDNKAKTALVMNGWKQAGKVSVQSNANLAYHSLWQTALYLFLLYFILALCLSLLGGLLIRNMMQPLKLIIQQAKDIGAKKLYLLTTKPKVRELRQLSETINQMVEKLQKIFTEQLVETEELRQKAYVDSLTGLGNRRYFFQQLDNFLKTENKYDPGYLVLIELEGLIEYNQEHGYHGGDQLLNAIAKVIKNKVSDQSIRMLSRLEGPSFAFILLDENPKPAFKLLNELYTTLHKTIFSFKGQLNISIAAARHRFGMDGARLVENSDELLQKARQNKQVTLYIQEPDAEEKKLAVVHSDDKIQSAINNEQFKVFKQPVKSDESLLHHEVYVKLITEAGDVPARIFLPIAKKVKADHLIDAYMFNHILNKADKTDAIAINLSSSVIHNVKRHDAFINLLEQHQHFNHQIRFEINEEMLALNEKKSLQFISELNRLGYKVGLDHVGATLLSFVHFKNSNISYLKLDGTMSKNLTDSEYKQKMIKNLVSICENMQIALIATQVESESQWKQLKELGIVWFQGNYIDKPIQY